jgi:hypothetical protein
VTLYTRGSDGFVSFTAALIASGWSEPSSRAGLSPAVVQRLSTAHVIWGFINIYRRLGFLHIVLTVSMMKRPRLFVSGAWLFHGAAWFLPVVTKIAGGRIGPPIRGWQAFVIASSAAWEGDNPWYGTVLAVLSVITTILFIFGSPWVVLRGTRLVLRLSAWGAAAAFFLNAHWLLGTDGWAYGLGIGYFLWWSSFMLLTLGLFDLAGQNDASAPAHSQAAAIPR